MIPDRITDEEIEVVAPVADAAPQADAPLLALLAELQKENAGLRARLKESETPVWLTVKEAASRANILYESMRRVIERGEVVATKIGGRVFADEKSLSQYIARHRKR